MPLLNPPRISALQFSPRFKLYSTRILSSVVLLRSLAFITLIYLLDGIVELGTSPLLLSVGAVVGILCGSWWAFTNLTALGALAMLALVWLLYRIIFSLAGFIPPGIMWSSLALESLSLHGNLLLLCAAIGLITTFGFWRTRICVTLELLFLLLAMLQLTASHRDFRLDKPKLISSLAWELGVSPLSAVVVLGLLFVAAGIVYLSLSTVPGKPVAVKGSPTAKVHSDRPLFFGGVLVTLALTALAATISYGVYQYYYVTGGTRLMGGVGQASKEEMSPLGFHSSLGGTNQPAALVRLEGDYSENPFTPMLYLRESALSSFNGREMVRASDKYDQDVGWISPDQPYKGNTDETLLERVPTIQSVYLLAQHKTVFAVDYPLSVKQLKNPNTDRFRATYRVYSLAPGFPLESLRGNAVGDARWDAEVREHYLKPHADQRYAALAHEVTQGIDDPIERAIAITAYFSKNAIYTLTPGHEVGKDEDPVAPFLFGDKRGYCVHFAHAMVYLLRSLGIPSRIGTGYLTDLSQSRDGHILLRMNDRHAWAEIYVANKGWIPFDPQPEQVENHGETPVDMKLLEELMGLVGPGEEIIPKEVARDEAGLKEDEKLLLPEPQHIMFIVVGALLVVFGIKAFLLFSWRFISTPEYKLRFAYRALVSRLRDLGFPRLYGETREEYRMRIQRELGQDVLAPTSLLNALSYSKSTNFDPTWDAGLGSFPTLPWKRRLFGLLNPSSVIDFILRRGW